MSNNNSRDVAPSVQWYVGMTEAEKKEFEAILLANKNNIVLHRLVSIVIDQITALNIQPEDCYDATNWAWKQADINGQKRGLRFVKDLLRFTNADHVQERI